MMVFWALFNTGAAAGNAYAYAEMGHAWYNLAVATACAVAAVFGFIVAAAG